MTSDPGRYLDLYTAKDNPYFGVVGIHDADPNIGMKEYLIGKQTLMDGVKTLVIDWRKAPFSRLFYDYDEGEAYEEEIQGRDREGMITEKSTVVILNGELYRVERNGEIATREDGNWVSGGRTIKAAEAKEKSGDHQLTDIIPLISPPQFKIISQEVEGCVLIWGEAGSGKTTVAFQRLSMLAFNRPELFRPEKCLALMFNKSLREYVRKTSKKLVGETPVETFSTWVLKAPYGKAGGVYGRGLLPEI